MTLHNTSSRGTRQTNSAQSTSARATRRKRRLVGLILLLTDLQQEHPPPTRSDLVVDWSLTRTPSIPLKDATYVQTDRFPFWLRTYICTDSFYNIHLNLSKNKISYKYGITIEYAISISALHYYFA